jgi:general secretion pathway protein M
LNRLAQAWNERSDNERRVLMVLGAIVAVALLVGLVWLPLERTRSRLAAELPKMRASLAALQRDADEVKRLRALPAPAATTQASAPLASVTTFGGGLAGAQMSVIDDRRVRLTGEDVSFSALLEWLRNVQSTFGMRVASARLESRPAAGRVRAELVLARG